MALTPEEALELAQLEAEVNDPKPVGALEGIRRGLHSSAARASRGIVDTAAWLGSDYVGGPLKKTAIKYGLAPSDEQLARLKAESDEAGGWGTVGSIGGDILAQFLPSKRVAQAQQLGGKTLNLGKDLIRDVGVATAMAPDEEKKEAAVGGALGTAAGTVLGKVVGGPLRKTMTEDAKLLDEAGITLGPGQAMSGTGAGPLRRTMAGVESALSKVPLLGGPMKYRISGSIEDYNKQQLNDLISFADKKVTAGGRKGIQEADEILTKSLEDAAPNLYLPAGDNSDIAKLIGGTTSVEKRVKNAKGISRTQTVKQEIPGTFLDDFVKEDPSTGPRVLATLKSFIETELVPHVKAGDIEGQVAYDLGRKLDFQAAKFARHSGPDNESLAKAFRKLRDDWFEKLEPKVAADPAHKNIILDVRAAKKRLSKMSRAAEQSAEGFFTPAQIRKLSKGEELDPVTEAASHILPEKAPKVNAGANPIFHRMSSPAGVAGQAGLGATSTLGWLSTVAPYVGAGALSYTKPAIKYMQRGTTPLVNMLRRKAGAGDLTPEELEFATELATSLGVRGAYQNRSEEE